MDTQYNAIPQNREGRETPGGRGGTFPTNERQFRDVCGKCGATRVDRQMGLEPTPELFVQGMVELFREIRRVLAPHGTCWVNLGDSYASSPPGNVAGVGATSGLHGANDASGTYRETLKAGHATKRNTVVAGLKPKDLVGIPWRVAFALQADGWWLRSDIIWGKPNPMPESVTDRPTKSHEYVFLLTKQPRYWFDAEAVREPHRWQDEELLRTNAQARQGLRIAERRASGDSSVVRTQPEIGREKGRGKNGNHESEFSANPAGRNVRSVWQIATQPYPEAHFATFPEELARRAILAGCPLRVCRVCGKPSERIVERESVSRPDLPRDHPEWRPSRYDNGKAGDPQAPGPGQRFSNVTTTGWTECDCTGESGSVFQDAVEKWRPGVVLDPFIGSGTTAKVARDHQRHAIGIDLNETYLELAARRLQQLSLLT